MLQGFIKGNFKSNVADQIYELAVINMVILYSWVGHLTSTVHGIFYTNNILEMIRFRPIFGYFNDRYFISTTTSK